MTGLVIYLVKTVNFTAFQLSSPAFIYVSCALTSQHEAVVVRAKDLSGSGEHWGLLLIYMGKECHSSGESPPTLLAYSLGTPDFVMQTRLASCL